MLSQHGNYGLNEACVIHNIENTRQELNYAVIIK